MDAASTEVPSMAISSSLDDPPFPHPILEIANLLLGIDLS